MGTTKKVKYMVANGTDYDMYAFETTSDQIKEGVLTTESQLSNGTDTQLVSAKLIRDALNKKANQADISNGLAYKGSCLYSELPSSDNGVGDFYYTTDEQHYYTWNGSTWNDTGIGVGDVVSKEEYNELKSDLGEIGERVEILETGGAKPVQTVVSGTNITLNTPVSGKNIIVEFSGEVRFGYSGIGEPSPTNVRTITPITEISCLHNGEKVSVQLNGTVGIGTVVDGILTVTHGIFVIDGETNKVASASGTFNKTIPDMKEGNRLDGYADWLPTVSSSSSAGIRFGANNSQIYIYKMSDVMGATATEANAYLSEHPLTIVYPLATARTIEVSDLALTSNGSDVLVSDINMTVTYWKQDEKDSDTDKTLAIENKPADAKATGDAIAEVSSSISTKVSEYFDSHPEVGDVTKQFQNDNSEITYGSDLLTDAIVTLGTNWSGNLSEGFTHATGSTEPITINVGSIDNTSVYAFQITTSNARLDGYSDFYVSLCGSETFETYKGGGSSVSYIFGLISGADGTGNLVITPKQDYDGTITNISLRKIETFSVKHTSIYTDLDGNAVSEIRLNGFDNGLLSIGLHSGENNFFGANNTAIGKNSLTKNTDGFWNTSLGYNTLNRCLHGSRNVAIGFIALQGLTTGDRNIAIGTFAMQGLTTGRNNIAIGADAMQTGNGSGNISIGTGSGGTGSFNTSIGSRAGNATKGLYNIFIGHQAGEKATTGGGNIIIGAGTNLDSPTDSNVTLIGRTNTKKTRVYGDFEVQGTDRIKRKIIFNEDGSCSWVSV